jgi:hypothetical protein
VKLVRIPAYSHNYADTHPIYRFENVRVPAIDRIGEEGAGMDFTYDWFRYERLMIAARCCGAAARLIASELDPERFHHPEHALHQRQVLHRNAALEPPRGVGAEVRLHRQRADHAPRPDLRARFRRVAFAHR